MIQNESLLDDFNQQMVENDENSKIYSTKKKFPAILVTLVVTGVIYAISFVLMFLLNTNRMKVSSTVRKVISFTCIISAQTFEIGLINFLALFFIFKKNSCGCNHKNKMKQMREILSEIFIKYVFSVESLNLEFQKHNEASDAEKVFDMKSVASSQEMMKLLDTTIENFFDSPEGNILLANDVSKSDFSLMLNDAINSISDETWIKVYNHLIHRNLNARELSPVIIKEFLNCLDETVTLVSDEGLDNMIGSNIGWVVIWASFLGMVFGALHILMFSFMKRR